MNWQETVRGKVSGKTQQTEIPAKPRLEKCKTGRQSAGKYMANQQDRNLLLDSGSAYRGSNPCLPATHSQALARPV
jgi:hypothetical protein